MIDYISDLKWIKTLAEKHGVFCCFFYEKTNSKYYKKYWNLEFRCLEMDDETMISSKDFSMALELGTRKFIKCLISDFKKVDESDHRKSFSEYIRKIKIDFKTYKTCKEIERKSYRAN